MSDGRTYMSSMETSCRCLHSVGRQDVGRFREPDLQWEKDVIEYWQYGQQTLDYQAPTKKKNPYFNGFEPKIMMYWIFEMWPIFVLPNGWLGLLHPVMKLPCVNNGEDFQRQEIEQCVSATLFNMPIQFFTSGCNELIMWFSSLSPHLIFRQWQPFVISPFLR